MPKSNLGFIWNFFIQIRTSSLPTTCVWILKVFSRIPLGPLLLRVRAPTNQGELYNLQILLHIELLPVWLYLVMQQKRNIIIILEVRKLLGMAVEIGNPAIIAAIVSAVVAFVILTVKEFSLEPRRWRKNYSNQQFRKTAADIRWTHYYSEVLWT